MLANLIISLSVGYLTFHGTNAVLGISAGIFLGISMTLVTAILLHVARMYHPVIKGIKVIPPDSILGLSAAIIGSNYRSHKKMLELSESYEGIAQFYLLGKNVVLINDRNIAKDALRRVLGKGEFQRANSYIIHKNIFNLDSNEEWLIRRTSFRKSFSMMFLKTKLEVINGFVSKLSNKLRVLAQNADNSIEMDKLFGQLTVDIICKVAFQLDLNALDDSNTFQMMHENLRRQFESTLIPRIPFAEYLIYLPIPFFTKFREILDTNKNFCRSILNHLRKLDKDGDLDDHGLGRALMNFGSLSEISEDDLLSEINLMFIAGHETTAHTLSWFIYALCKYQDIQEKCHEIIDNFFSTGTDKTDNIEIPPYIEAVLKESMRKYTVASFGSFRKVTDESGFNISIIEEELDKVNIAKRVNIPKDNWILVNLYSLHNSAFNWGDDSKEFKPSRWMNSDDSGNSFNRLSQLSIYCGGGKEDEDLIFAPFSFGQRNCLGINLALMETKITIKELLKHFHFSFSDEIMKDEDIALESVVTLRPNSKLRVNIALRLE